MKRLQVACLGAMFSLLIMPAFALEVSASTGNMRKGASEAKLSAQIQALTAIVESLGSKLSQFENCADNQMLYSPLDPSADIDGCISLSSSTTIDLYSNVKRSYWTTYNKNTRSKPKLDLVSSNAFLCGIYFRANCDFRSSEDGCLQAKVCELGMPPSPATPSPTVP